MLLIGGWMDELRRPGPPDARALRQRAAPGARSATGSTSFPDDAYPGPNLDWLHELVRFFDHWLKGVDNGVMDEPGPDLLPARLRAARAVPGERGPARGGASRRSRPRGPVSASLWLAAGERAAGRPARSGAPAERSASIGSRTGRRPAPGPRCRGAPAARRTGSPAISGSTTPCSRRTRAPPLVGPVEILGFARAELVIAASMPVATVVVRLTDVAPDGTTAQVAAGVLNLTHRDVARRAGAARAGARRRRSASRCARPATGSRRATGSGCRSPRTLAGALAVAVPGELRDPPRTVAPRPADDPAGRGLAAGAGVQDEPGGSRGVRDGIVRAAGLARSSRTSSPGRSRSPRTRPARRRLPDGTVRLRRRAARDDRLGRRPGPRPDGQPRSTTGWPRTAAGSRSGHRARRPRPRPTSG